MNPSKPKLTKEEQKAKELEVSAAKEAVFHLVSKVISWKTLSQDSVSMQAQEKISAVEWKRYEKHLLAISKTEDVSVVKEKLKITFSAIQSNQGFE